MKLLRYLLFRCRSFYRHLRARCIGCARPIWTEPGSPPRYYCWRCHKVVLASTNYGMREERLRALLEEPPDAA